MSILQNLAKIKEAKEKNKAKDTRCDIDLSLSISDSDSLPKPLAIGEKTPSHSVTNLGTLDYEAVKKETTKSKKTKRGSYQTYSAVERFNIEKHASEYGTASTLKKLKNAHPQLKEYCRGIRLKYEEELHQASREKRDLKSSLSIGRGRPLMLGKIDLMVQEYLRVCIAFRIYIFNIFFV